MKNITTIIMLFTLLAFSSFNAKAQGDLQFNRSVFERIFDHSNVAPSVVKFDTLVVDSGKTLKITAASTHIYTDVRPSVKLAGFELATLPGYGGPLIAPVYPIWLPAGTYIIESSYYYNNNSLRRDLYCIISGIEFNVVQ